MHNSMRNGPGKFYYRDGGYYDGVWKNNMMNGYGKLYYDNGKLAYEGQWYKD
jgi:antitoxin component YwqK of YwqJK toxin-antitoxin module